MGKCITNDIAFLPLMCLNIHKDGMEMFFVVGAKVYSIQFEGYKSFPSGIENEVEISPYVSVLIGKTIVESQAV